MTVDLRTFRQSLLELVGKPTAFDDRKCPGLVPAITDLYRGAVVSDEILLSFGRSSATLGARKSYEVQSNGAKTVAVISMRGIALYATEMQPLCFSTLRLAQTLRAAAADSTISAILLDIDSPGGSVTGTKEAGDAVWAARQKKPVIAYVNPLAASAAYWIASQANKIVGTTSGDVGSIGVYMMHVDLSGMMAQNGVRPTLIYAGQHKVDGNPYEPLKSDARDWSQRECNEIYRQFNHAVARGRGVSAEHVAQHFGQGRTFMAPEAKALGLIDTIGDSSFALEHARLQIEYQRTRQILALEALK